MPKGNNELKKLLADKVERVTISKSDHNTQDKKEITAFMMDTISKDEKAAGPISINALGETKKCIYQYLKLHRWSTCDYLYICLDEEVSENKATFYFIEQTDIELTFMDRMENPEHMNLLYGYKA